MAGLQRDGLKAEEVFRILKLFKGYVEEGESEDVAYSLAIRGTSDKPIVGVSAETFKGWKPDIIKLAHGEPTPADSLAAATLSPDEGKKQADPAIMRRLGALGDANDALKGDHKRALTENEELRKQLAAALSPSEIEVLRKQAAEGAALRDENEKLKKAMLGGDEPAGKKPAKTG